MFRGSPRPRDLVLSEPRDLGPLSGGGWLVDESLFRFLVDFEIQKAQRLRYSVAIVCFDPFPSVSRYVARHRLRVPVLLDGERRMRAALPCPSVPYTYVLDREGRIAAAQPGEVDWFAEGSRAALRALLREAHVPAAAAPTTPAL